jgi:5-methyltetrahydropteroyltriglutamate--homocysteine methyltransferase
MRRSTDRILTTHAGSLPRPDDLLEVNRARLLGEAFDRQEFDDDLEFAVQDVVGRQKAAGIDVPNDGEYGHSMGTTFDFAAWWTYVFERLGGTELADFSLFEMAPHRSAPGDPRLTSMADRRDRALFAAAYSDPDSGVMMGRPVAKFPVVRAPLSYVGRDQVLRDTANLHNGLACNGLREGFLNAVAPGSCARFADDYYRDEDAFLEACATVMREEYRMIVESGLVLQLDDPCIAENWDQINPEPSVADYQRFTMKRVEAINAAIEGLPADRIRFHLCWGSWHGPHVTDIPMRDIVEVMLQINAGAYMFEAGNVRHEHEWKVWRDVELPPGKIIMPGVVSHATNVVEHPEVVADRIVRFAEGVGRENVVASTDCGLGGRVHPQIAWAKLRSLAQGAELASERLW